MMQMTNNSAERSQQALNELVKNLNLKDLHTSFDLLAAHRHKGTENAALVKFEKIKQGHNLYKTLNFNTAQLCGIELAQGTEADQQLKRAPTDAVILSSQAHFNADVVVVRCMDNRCSSPNVELNMRPHQVCEVVSAGHVLEEKDLESLAVGIALKGAKVILLEAHGGTCGAVQLALMEKEAGLVEHAMTEKILHGLGKYRGVDTPEIFAATLENLNEQMGKILNPKMELKLLRNGTGMGSFYDLFREGRCLILGVYVDFEVLTTKDSTAVTIIKRLTFFESFEAVSNFVDAKIAAYLSQK